MTESEIGTTAHMNVEQYRYYTYGNDRPMHYVSYDNEGKLLVSEENTDINMPMTPEQIEAKYGIPVGQIRTLRAGDIGWDLDTRETIKQPLPAVDEVRPGTHVILTDDEVDRLSHEVAWDDVELAYIIRAVEDIVAQRERRVETTEQFQKERASKLVRGMQSRQMVVDEWNGPNYG